MAGARIYKCSLTSQITVLVELADAHSENEKWFSRIENKATKEETLSEISSNGMFKAGLKNRSGIIVVQQKSANCALLRNEGGEQVLRDLLSYDPKRNDGC